MDAALLVDSSFEGEVELVPGQSTFWEGRTEDSGLLKLHGELVA